MKLYSFASKFLTYHLKVAFPLFVKFWLVSMFLFFTHGPIFYTWSYFLNTVLLFTQCPNFHTYYYFSHFHTNSYFLHMLLFAAITIWVVLLAAAVGCAAASRTLHNNLLIKILHAPMSFFDTTPLGRIMNRYYIELDEKLNGQYL